MIGRSGSAESLFSSERSYKNTSELLGPPLPRINKDLESYQKRSKPKRRKFDMEKLMKNPEIFRMAMEQVLKIEREQSAPVYTVHFSVHYGTHYGESIIVAGNIDALGQWDSSKALRLEWSEGNVWAEQLSVREHPSFEYKYVCIGAGKERWEGGGNRKIGPGRVTRDGKVNYIQRDSWQP